MRELRGLSSIITDYTRKIFGDYVHNIDRLRKGILAVWAGLSLASFAGLAYSRRRRVQSRLSSLDPGAVMKFQRERKFAQVQYTHAYSN